VDATFSYLKRSLESGHEGGKTQPHSIIGSTHDEPQESSINKAEPTVDVSVSKKASIAYEMYGYQDTWSSLYGYGTVFDISSVDGESRYFTGGMCGRGEGYQTCDTSTLSPGTYIWRVTGSLDSHKDSIAWTFCSVSGGATTEVLFQIDEEGHCAPLMTTIAGSSFLDHKLHLPDSEEEKQQLQYNSVTDKSESTSHLKILKSDLLHDSVESVTLQSDQHDNVDTHGMNGIEKEIFRTVNQDANHEDSESDERGSSNKHKSNKFVSPLFSVNNIFHSRMMIIGFIAFGIIILSVVVLNHLLISRSSVVPDTTSHIVSFTRPRQLSGSISRGIITNNMVNRIEHFTLSGMREYGEND